MVEIERLAEVMFQNMPKGFDPIELAMILRRVAEMALGAREGRYWGLGRQEAREPVATRFCLPSDER